MSDEADGIERTRATLRASDDARAARTRQRLFDAAERICSAGGAVSVSAIVREADVSRSAFYAHFADVGDLALRMQEPLFETIAARAVVDHDRDPHRAMAQSQRRLAEHFWTHRSLYRAAFLLPGHAVVVLIEEAMRAPIREHIERYGAPTGIRPDLVARYVGAAATHLLESWTLGDIHAEPEEIAEHLFALLPAWMHAAPDGPSTTTAEEREEPS